MPLALYRRYRPKKLSEVIGQETNVQILKNAAKQGKLSHAYLFYGPRGTGKTTTARLIAKLLNCERRRADKTFAAEGEPCNKCRACNEIDAQNAFDVIEIDAASNRGIDEIRNLKESITVAPAGNPFKVYIIDEAHMLTPPAFNALLKTLEEPPRHAVIILATTEYEKLPPTITSRTQRFHFKKLPKVKIMEKLKKIVADERLKIDDDALELIAAAGEGSFRDAESLLEQAVSWEKGNITLKAVEEITGRVGLAKVSALSRYVISRDLKKTLSYLRELSDEGNNLVELTKNLIHYLRRVLTLKLNPALESAYHLELTSDEIKTIKELGGDLDPTDAISLLRSLIRAYGEMRYSPFALVPLEIALIEQIGKYSSLG